MDIQRIKNFWEGEAAAYSSTIQEELEGSAHKNWQAIIRKWGGDGNLEILDAGCGPGFFPIILSELGHHVVGIDLTENMIACARKNATRWNAKADFAVMDCQKTSFANNTFDLVVTRNLTWTLQDPQKAYQEWLRILKPGGRLLVSDANWYHHLFYPEKAAQYREDYSRAVEKYGLPVHSHTDPEEEKALGPLLYMSDKIRPVWDLDYMLQIGFSKVFAEADISNLIREPFAQEAYRHCPQFLVGGEK